ncbi:MAG: methyltransferase domain-containing protein [Chloroflexota bacterium]|nr:methyltransferase domain-containing protein [Chloroflexota bacterium]
MNQHLPPRPPKPPPSPRPPAPGPRPPDSEYEAEIIPGLGAMAQADLGVRAGAGLTFVPATRPDVIRFRYRGDVRALLALRSVVALARVAYFAVPRPQGLLGNEQFSHLLGLIDAVRRLHPPGTFRTLRLSAAGEDSAVLLRLRAQLVTHTGLREAAGEGDLLLRLRRAAGGDGWEAVLRLSPRPLTARAWRVCNWPGALNAVVAQAMVRLGTPSTGDRVLNLVCGSGTLLVERLALGPVALAVGYDTDAAALDCATRNLAAAGVRTVRLVQADAGQLPFPAGLFTHLVADLPFGQLVGSHVENTRLYPRLLAEATRVAAPGAHLTLITHEVRLLDRLLAAPPLAAAWEPVETLRITLPFGTGGLNPRIYCLRRTG